MSDSKLFVVGINHKSAPFDVREDFQLSRKEIPQALNIIKSYDGVDEVLILATCNRVGFYLVLKPDTEPVEVVNRFYSEFKSIDFESKKQYFFVKENSDVTRHLFRVIAGLESMVLGEYQIQGQVREAYSLACKEKTVDTILHKLLHAAFRAGKKVRSGTTLGTGKQSVSGAASEILSNNLNTTDTILIIGVNENSKIMAETLHEAGFRNFIFANRTYYKAQMMAETYGGRACDLNNLDEALFESAGVFTSTGAPGYIISDETLRRLAVQERAPKIMVDMAVPRDIEAVFLPHEILYFDIGALQVFLDETRKQQLADTPVAEKIIEDEVAVFQAWSETPSSNVLKPYVEKFEIVRQQILDENRDQFSEQTQPGIDRLTKSLVHRLQSTFIRILIKMEEERQN